jgi:hypothetical protein
LSPPAASCKVTVAAIRGGINGVVWRVFADGASRRQGQSWRKPGHDAKSDVS